MASGIVFSIEEFAINDGPGIRTTVFLKGCPLRCTWCHNPEGQSFRPEIMHHKDGDRICGKEYTAEELAARLKKDGRFLEMNGGGITFTGGEPLSQPEFLADVLTRLEPMHRAIETSGYAPEKVFKRILQLTDLVLFDLKAMDPGVHKRYISVDNTLILKNFETLKQSGRPFVVRLPMIPGVNDNPEHMLQVKKTVEGARNLIRVEMLRYHKTAGAKYQMIDRKYEPQFDVNADIHIYNVFENTNIKTLLL